jgi:3-methylcrotonyl-CoA carboxylase alpha subunit
MTEKIVTLAGRQYELRAGAGSLEILSIGPQEAEIRIGGRTHVVPYAIDGTRISFAFDGEIYSADVVDKAARARVRHRDHSMAAPMPGLVLKILVQPGAVVTKGMPLIILEAMKMEHQIVAPHDGTVAAINCSEGQMVEGGVDLVELKGSDLRFDGFSTAGGKTIEPKI